MRIRVGAAVVLAWAVLIGAAGPAYAEPVADPVTEPVVAAEVLPPAPDAPPEAPPGLPPGALPEAPPEGATPPPAPEVVSPTLIGNPAAAAPFWGMQRYDDCTLMAVADVVGQITGTKPSEDDMIARAATIPNSTGTGPLWSMPSDPPPPPRVRKMQLPMITELPALLNQFNIPSVVISNAGMLPLEDALRAGKKVIASVNGETIWNQDGNRSVHNHVVVVTGVDPALGVVHLNDSAIVSPGPDSRVSLAAFVDAWRTSDYSMLIAG